MQRAKVVHAGHADPPPATGKDLLVSESEMTGSFATPTDLKHNRGLIADPAAFANDAGAPSWLYLCGEEFAVTEGGMSYSDVEAAVPESENLIADPTRPFDMDVARRGVAALDKLPRPSVTCRTGPRPRPCSISTRDCAQAPRPMRCSRGPRRTTHRSRTRSR